MNFRRVTVGVVAISAVLALSGCGSNDSDTAATTSTTTTTTETAPPLKLPTAAELNALLAKGMDPATPIEEKVAMVGGSDQDPELINQVAAAAQKSGAQVQVLDPVIDNGDGTASAQLQLTLNGEVQPNGIPAIFIPAANGTWKLSKATACTIVSFAQLTSPACPA
ncbi:MAG: hypothetical protein WAW17_17000 [Rhodococcus sp. (in: high G+C Gram-positive bacteria)]|uniref:hypothetical protein n=1 Tax=Rhodococcus sp. TaxID=1831 RepID=UPI003BB20CF4